LLHFCVYQLEALPEWFLFMSLDNVTLDVCQNQRYKELKLQFTIF